MAGRAEITPLLAETFREHGYEGASLALICKATGLGKGSLYNLFPKGKEEMAAAVLDEIEVWFEREVFAPLATGGPAATAKMFDAVDAYFRTGGRVCLVGAFALADTRERFAARLRTYFTRWIDALSIALTAGGHKPRKARARAEEIVAGVQGAIVLARALDDQAAFTRILERLRRRTASPQA